LQDEILRLQNQVQELESLRFRDDLTGLPNRAGLSDRFTVAQAYAKRTNGSIVVMMVDIDEFKTINDTLGHKEGDNVLCEVSERLSLCLREYDTVARIGGDEFIMIPSCRAEDAEDLAKRIIKAFRKRFSKRRKITISLGVSLYPIHGLTLPDLMEKADVAMYRAKAAGRNKYMMFNE